MHPTPQEVLQAYWGYVAAFSTVVAGLSAWIGGIVAGRIARKEAARFEREFWHFQRSWTEREKFFSSILTSLYKLERFTSSGLERFAEPDYHV
jgi:hypothetical protein